MAGEILGKVHLERPDDRDGAVRVELDAFLQFDIGMDLSLEELEGRWADFSVPLNLYRERSQISKGQSKTGP